MSTYPKSIEQSHLNVQPAHVPSKKPVRPEFHWLDVWNAPLHDLPVRDEILYQYLKLLPSMRVLEAGPGSGITAFNVSRMVRHMTLVDASEKSLQQLPDRLHYPANVRYLQCDLSLVSSEALGRNAFDAAFALDVFEYIKDPAQCLQNFAHALSPGGTLLLTFPNVTPPQGDGVTHFATHHELETLLLEAGFTDIEIFPIRKNPMAEFIYQVMHEWPAKLARRLRKRQGNAPQIYDATWAHQHDHSIAPLRPLLHLYWYLLDKMMHMQGEVFERLPHTENILGHQIVVCATRKTPNGNVLSFPKHSSQSLSDRRRSVLADYEHFMKQTKSHRCFDNCSSGSQINPLDAT